MISICLLLMFLLVLFRPSSILKPSWLATAAGAVSISTWGFLEVSAHDLDGLIGGSNWITLVRDVFATLAFWFYREAVGRSTSRRPLGSPRTDATGVARVPWLLLVLIAAYSIPFALIEAKGDTSSRFVLDRLEQPAVWLFGTIYMTGLLFLSIDAIRLLRWQRGLLRLVSIGYCVTAVGCLIEIAYLTGAHLGIGGATFRASGYSAAEIPFFTGLIVIGLIIAWNAVRTWGRYRWSLAQLLALSARTRAVEIPAMVRLQTLFASSPRKAAFRLWVAIQNRVGAEAVHLTPRDSEQLDRIGRRFSEGPSTGAVTAGATA